jgi:hypothetical protein
VGYFDVWKLGLAEAIDLLEWSSRRYNDDTKKAFKPPPKGSR